MKKKRIFTTENTESTEALARKNFLFFSVSSVVKLFLIIPVWMSGLTLEEKVGELFVMPICPQRGKEHFDDVKVVMEKYHISSVIVKRATPDEQIRMLGWLGEGVFVFQDAEWGLGMRMDETISFPKNGYLRDEELIYLIGREIARELRIIGCHVNLSPVCDVNSNLNNVIIGLRSFGSDPEDVARKAVQMTKGLQDGGILACGKHFPGHGDTSVDSHISLPVVYKTKEELQAVEFIPFQAVIDAGIGSIMTAHLHMKNLNQNPIQILREEMKFGGLVISDAMNMKGVPYSSEEAALIYLREGHDLLLYGDHIAPNVDYILREMIPKAYNAVLKAVKNGELNIDDKLAKIREAKKKWLKPREEGILNSEEASLLRDLSEKN